MLEGKNGYKFEVPKKGDWLADANGRSGKLMLIQENEESYSVRTPYGLNINLAVSEITYHEPYKEG